MTTVRVLAPYFTPAVDGGGPIRTLDALTRTAPDRFVVEVVTRDRDLGATNRLDVPTVPFDDAGRTIRFLDTRGVPGLISLARAMCARPVPTLTYVNSVFDARFAILPMALHRLGLTSRTRFLVAPRGEFDPGALALKSTKKRAYLAAGRRTGLFRGIVWHASTDTEAAHIRAAVGADAEVVVRENETSLPESATRRPAIASDRLELVCVGRISPKKRTHLAIEALATVERPVRLTVIGPVDDEAYGRRCRKAADALPAHVVVEFVGSREHGDVLAALRSAHAMVAPTAGENFGHTIAEALASACPVLLSDTTPWTNRIRAGGGEVVGDDGWSAAIERWAAAGPDHLDRRSAAAADAYDDWRRRAQAPHVFDMLMQR